MEDEVTRVEQVRYLQGALGHAVGSTAFLVVGGVLVWSGSRNLGVVCFVVAFGVTANGLSIYAWDRLRSYFEARAARADDGSDRTLTPHSPSPEFRAEVLSGFVLVAGLVVVLLAVTTAVRTFDPGTVGYALVGLLAAGNLAALLREYYSTKAGE